MSYAKFTRKKLIEEYGFRFIREVLFPKVIPLITPSDHLLFELEEATQLPLNNEKAQSELLIVPVLKEVWRNSGKRFAIHSGDSLDVDPQAGFSGECDFILTADTVSIDIVAPILSLVEAKKDNFDAGITQGAAQLYAALLFNERKGMATPYLWGCSANGWGWQFFQLRSDKEVIVHPPLLGESNLPELLGAWKMVIDESLAMVNIK
jgi:hypothetical protein